MNERSPLKVPIIGIDEMFISYTQVFVKPYCNSWSKNTDEIISRWPDISMDHVIIINQRSGSIFPHIKRALNLSLHSTTKIIVSNLRTIGTNLSAVSGKGDRGDMDIRLKIGCLVDG